MLEMRTTLLVSLAVAINFLEVVGQPKISQRIVGGSTAAISQYPYAASLLHSWNLVIYRHLCGGTIITTTAVLSAAQCFVSHAPTSWRVRVGSNLANSGGSVYVLRSIALHQQYDSTTSDNDIAVLRTENLISYDTGRIAAASLAGGGYLVADNQPVWAIGWGAIFLEGPMSEELRHVHLRLVGLDLCRLRYSELGLVVTENMLCAGWLEEGGRGMCAQDVGGPLVHNRVVVGVLSWTKLCGLARYPSVATRVSIYIPWIRSVAVG